VHPDQIWRNSSGRLGDVLVLTKPIGLGTVTTGIKKGVVPSEIAANAVQVMAQLNRDAAEVARAIGVTAATDVTGFSLLGHALEMADGSGLGLELSVDSLPVIDGAWDTLKSGIAPGATGRNLTHFGARVEWGSGVVEHQKQLLCDPQTSGGLLLAVHPDKASAFMDALHQANVHSASIVGRLTEKGIRVVS
jgi:selenide,water dikinase